MGCLVYICLVQLDTEGLAWAIWLTLPVIIKQNEVLSKYCVSERTLRVVAGADVRGVGAAGGRARAGARAEAGRARAAGDGAQQARVPRARRALARAAGRRRAD